MVKLNSHMLTALARKPSGTVLLALGINSVKVRSYVGLCCIKGTRVRPQKSCSRLGYILTG